jgi:2-aminoadipate transaminase
LAAQTLRRRGLPAVRSAGFRYPTAVSFDAFLSADARVMQSSIIRQLTGLVNRPDVISFAAGSPNADTFPHEQLREIFDDLVGRERGKLFQYSVTRGNAELIEAVRARTAAIQGIEASQEETILVSGSQQGLDFVARTLVDPGDAVFVELPNFIGASAAFENFRARMFGVRKSTAGMDLEDLRRQIAAARAAGAQPKLIYVIPNFQNPSGHTWSLENRRGLLELARDEDLLIFEDDAYGEIYFPGVEPAQLRAIKSLEGAERVIYMSTFSKILAAGLRLAWIVGPAEIVRRIELAKETGDLCSSTVSQKLILEYLRRGWMQPHLDHVRAFYAAKVARMHAALERHFPGKARWNRPQGGLFLWVELLREIDTLELLRRIVESEKIAFIPGQPFFVDRSGSNTLRLSFSNVSDENIEIGLERLSRLID